MKEIKIGIIGGGLMGREMASAFARWCALLDVEVRPVLTAVADTNPAALEWFAQLPSAPQRVTDYHALLANPEVEVVYAAVPHRLHGRLYQDVLAAGKDLLAEKPFAMDLATAREILVAVRERGRFVRCSSEFPFLPGALPHRRSETERSDECGVSAAHALYAGDHRGESRLRSGRKRQTVARSFEDLLVEICEGSAERVAGPEIRTGFRRRWCSLFVPP